MSMFTNDLPMKTYCRKGDQGDTEFGRGEYGQSFGSFVIKAHIGVQNKDCFYSKKVR